MPQAGEIFLAGRADHLTLLPSGQLHYLPALPSDIHRPSIDIFFSSVAAAWPRSGSAILLTGMGRDGAAGLLKLRQQGFSTLAQSESSCIVYGMPKAGYDCGAVQELLSPSEIGLWLHRRYSPDSIAHTQAAPRSKAQFDRVALQRLVALRPARISKER
jgi:two-component system response regulator WspF